MDAFINKAARERSQRWIAVNWDRWQRLEDGPEDETELSMTSDEGLEALHRILSWANARQVLVSTGDLKARLENLAPIKASAVESLFRRKPDMADWFYIPSWKKSALPIGQDKNDGNKGGGKQGSWLVFTNETPMAIRLIEKLQQKGIEGVTVVMGPEFARLGEGKYTINPQIPGNYDTLFKELVEAGAIPVNILHLWCATGDDHPGCELEELEKIQDLGLYSLLYIAQSIGKQNMGAAVQIGVVSTCLQPVTGKELLRPARATLLGPIKIIPVEYSNIDCCSIDISPLALKKPEHERMADELIREFEANFSQSRVVAYRENQRYVQDYEPVRINKQNGSARLKQRGIYLITGGLGGIGFTLAQYLATNFKARLILTDISGFPLTEANVKKIKEMEKQGAEVLVEQADVAIFEQMEKVILGAEKRFGKIDGVIQAAGLIDYAGVIQKRTRQMTQNVLAAKVKGTLVLEQLLQKCSLDFLVLFSSIGNMMPRLKFGQVGYNAGHEFMDIFAYYKQAQGMFTVTIDWNDWLEVGMSVEADRRSEAKSSAARRFAEATSITPSEGLRAFNLVLGCNYPQVAICPSDLKQMIAYMFSSKYEDLDFFALPGTLRERPQMDAEYIAPGGPIEEKLVEIFQKLFGFERIGVKDDFFQLGGDSLKAMTAIAHIHKRLNTQIPLVEFFKRPYVMGLAEYIRQIKQEACISIEPVEKKEYYELSPAQKRMYIVYRMDSDNTSYNSSKILPLADKVEKDRLELTFKKLIQRHESLRTSFHMLNDTLIQKIHQDVAFEVEYHDLAGVGTAEETVSNSQSAATTVRNFIRPFDLSRAPLLRVGLVKTTDLNYILMVDMHHIISDGVTVNIVISDYNSLHSGKSLPPLRLQYKDYVEWQNREHREESLKKQEAYWLGQFQGGVSTLCLPYDYERPAVYRADGAALRFTLPPDTGTALKQLALDTGTTLFMVLLAIYNVLLGKISGQEAIVIGTALTGRRHIDLEHIVGMFVNMLALPNYPRPDKSFTSFLSEVKNSTLEALDNQDYQFEDLVDRLALKRDSSRHPLFDVAFSYMEVEKKVEEIPGNGKFELDFNLNEMVNITSKYDLTLILLAATDQLSFSLEYCTKLFKEKKIKRFISYFKNIVNLIVEKPGIKISEIEIISDEEEKRLLKNLRMKQGDAYPGDLQEAVKLPDSQEAEFDF